MKRRKSTIVKLLLAVPVIWFGFICFAIMTQGNGSSDTDDLRFNGHRDLVRQRLVQTHRPDKAVMAPVIEEPNIDQLKFQERMRQDAERELRMKEQALHEEHRSHHGSQLNEESEGGMVLMNPGAWNKLMEIGKGLLGRHEDEKHDKMVLPKYDPNAPGEQGKPVIIKKEDLSKEERDKFNLGWKNNAFNAYASDLISVHRSLPDMRDPECTSQQYHKTLPDTSVIICFHNEAWSVLIRTVHSVLDRSPANLIREIILVDDYSDMPHLMDELETYVAKLGKVKILRAKKREGLIRARLLGATHATGEVLTYLDSHCEATDGWLEPLLDRIASNWTNVITPVIDVLSDDTLGYQHSSATATSVGGFDWNLQFNWHGIPESEKKRRKSYVEPVRSPTMAGGLFSINKKYFEYLGTYDPGMDIWGGENLELSFRIWMCGGTLEIAPCSHVGHIFRKRSPYKWKSGENVVKKNSVRLAEVWLDDYKKYYYERFNFDLGQYGDVSGRKALRERLQCKSFDWYLRNIYPQLFIPGDAVASGEIKNQYKPMCLDSPVDSNAMNKPIKTWPCHRQGGNQFWMMSKEGEIRRDEGCMDYAGQFVMIYPCHGMRGNQEWTYTQDNQIKHVNSNLCVELSEDGQKIEMKSCSGEDRQVWLWKRNTKNSTRALEGR